MLSAACIPPLQPVFNELRVALATTRTDHKFPVVIEWRKHPFPFRTRQLSSTSPMILRGQLRGKVGRRRDNIKGPRENPVGLFLFPQYQFTKTRSALPGPSAGS